MHIHCVFVSKACFHLLYIFCSLDSAFNRENILFYHLVIGTNVITEFTEIVRDDPTNNIPDTIFAKLGMQLHRRNQHPLGILKNAIYDYFDTNYPDKFDKFDDLCPIVSIRQVGAKRLRKHFFALQDFVFSIISAFWRFCARIMVLSYPIDQIFSIFIKLALASV